MRGDRRCSSFRKEKPAGLSRALSWLSVSTLSRQSRRIFHSQNELHAVHNRQTHSYSHTHLCAADGDEVEDDDNWVYQPQHKTGEGERRKENQQCGDNLCHWLLILVVLHLSVDAHQPDHVVCLSWHVLALTMLGPDLNGFLFSLPTRRPVNDFVYMHKQSKKWITVFLWPLVLLVHVPGTSWLL